MASLAWSRRTRRFRNFPTALQHAVFGNAGTLIAFRVGSLDAKRLAGELGLTNATTLTQTNNYHAWAKLMRYGAPLEPRLIETFAPPFPGLRFEKVVAFARSTHMMPRRAGRRTHRRVLPEAAEKEAATSEQTRC